jgi:hypothetical protein
MRTKHQNIPANLHKDDREVVAFLQGILNYKNNLVQTGTRIKWKSTATPAGGYLQCNGQTIVNAQYPDLVAYARNDADFVVGITTTTLPTDADFFVKT